MNDRGHGFTELDKSEAVGIALVAFATAAVAADHLHEVVGTIFLIVFSAHIQQMRARFGNGRAQIICSANRLEADPFLRTLANIGMVILIRHQPERFDVIEHRPFIDIKHIRTRQRGIHNVALRFFIRPITHLRHALGHAALSKLRAANLKGRRRADIEAVGKCHRIGIQNSLPQQFTHCIQGTAIIDGGRGNCKYRVWQE